ncbi:MAG: multiprotein bridging factor aMBF1 [ANME-2 cluster archaeon]|nr:multiprotein bridging factor aMBF1 [ANME-2 cluster archaeon]
MQCEICGVEIIGKPRKVVVEGTEVEVCGKCAQYGTAPQSWSPVSKKMAPVSKAPLIRTKKQKPNPFNTMGEEIIANYSQVIREARDEKGWSQEELAHKTKVKVSLIRKVEREEIMPEDSLRKILEKTLDIKLTERVSHDLMEEGGMFKSTTLGDIVKIKRK